jgi:hypothetical protein
MFKTIGRISVILLVAALVAVGVYALVQTGNTNSTSFTPDRQFESHNTNGTSIPRDQFGERGGEGGFSLGRGLGGALATLLKIGAIAFIVIQVQKALAKSPRPTRSGSA